MKNIGVFIGRFQPLHYGHINIINQALNDNEIVLILIGSKNVFNERNPFSFEIRKSFFTTYFNSNRIFVDGIDDYNDDKIWCNKVDEIIKNRIILDINDCNIKLYGPKKDKNTEKYIDYILENSLIKNYVNAELTLNENIIIDATLIRNYLKDTEKNKDLILKYIPEKVFNIISNL